MLYNIISTVWYILQCTYVTHCVCKSLQFKLFFLNSVLATFNTTKDHSCSP